MMNQSEGYEEAKRRIQEAKAYNSTTLWLLGLGLSDLPPEIAQCNSLKYIELEANKFKKLPKILLELPQLEDLSLEKNPLHEIPNWISELKHMQGLSFYECELAQVPTEIGELSELERLELSGNHLVNLPESIGKLKKLESLSLSVNTITSLPDTFGDLEQLNSLALGVNNLKELPDSFSKLHNLEWLEIPDNAIQNLPSKMDEMKSLRNLNISSNLITELPNGLDLEYLDISNCRYLTKLPLDLKVKDTIHMNNMRFDEFPVGCKSAIIKIWNHQLQHQWITNPETITMTNIISAKDKWERENLLNLMGYQRLLAKIDFVVIDTFEDDELSAKLIKLELSESEKYLIVLDKSSLKYGADWLPEKIDNCQDALKRYEQYSNKPWSYKNFV